LLIPLGVSDMYIEGEQEYLLARFFRAPSSKANFKTASAPPRRDLR